MEKNYLFDVDGLLQVLKAIKEEKPVEYRPLEEPDWRDFDPEDCNIDTENCKYRVKPVEYGDHVGVVTICIEDLEEDRIYLVKHSNPDENCEHFICVKSNLWRWNKIMSLHFSWYKDEACTMLNVCDPNIWNRCHSEYSETFVNGISPNLIVSSFINVAFFQPSQAQVKMLEAKLREIGYELKNGEMKKIDGNEE